MFREMARKNKQLSMEDCVQVLKQETRGVLSVLGDDEYPYGMPMNHWYNEEDGKIYFHCGKTGHRLDALKKHDKVSFCTYDKGSRNEGEWAWRVKSVIVFGRIEILDDMDKIIDITTKLSHKFAQDDAFIKSPSSISCSRRGSSLDVPRVYKAQGTQRGIGSIKKEIENSGHRTLLLQLTPEHICGKQVTEA